MALRKIKNQPSTLIGSPITIYYDSDYSEYQVKIKGQPDATYFTNDINDALRTAQLMRNAMLKKNPAPTRYNDGFAKMELQTIATAFDNGTMTVSTAKSRVFGYLGIDIKARTKKGFLKELANYVYSEPKQNPAPKRKTQARTQSRAEAYVNRPSQVTRKPPTKRLKVRRTKNLRIPEGAFPNPKERAKTYKVETLNSTSGKWRRVATFEKLTDAKEYANAYVRAKTTVAVRVVD